MPEQSLLQFLNSRIGSALTALGYGDARPNVQPSRHSSHGDYQVNGLILIAQAFNLPPLWFAQSVLNAADFGDIVEDAHVSGPGFINITISSPYLERWIAHAAHDDGLSVAKVPKESARRVVIDYSSPNLAKEMHVGHLRSTIIGDALARVLRFLGYDVVAQNHVGDWGTQFGMLIAYMLDLPQATTVLTELIDLEDFYRKAKRRFEDEPEFSRKARDNVVRLQRGDPSVREAWSRFVEISLDHCEAIYRRLGVSLTSADVRGESAFNADLSTIVADLRIKELAVDNEGAQVVFLSSMNGDKSNAFIVQKRDGGYLYSTTDLAAIRYRATILAADRILYVVDERQRHHFRQLFQVARLAGYAPSTTTLEHVTFGVILGEDKKPFKTRSGELVKLADLLNEATRRAYKFTTTNGHEFSKAERMTIAEAVGIGAVKYFDLSKNRNTDYVFDWDDMLSLNGNTAPYLQYAYVRLTGILHRAGPPVQPHRVALNTSTERDLAIHLARFSDTLYATARDAQPNYLCSYLFALATNLMRFYEACPVLQASASIRESRLQICKLAADTIRAGLDLLGIKVLERM